MMPDFGNICNTRQDAINICRINENSNNSYACRERKREREREGGGWRGEHKCAVFHFERHVHYWKFYCLCFLQLSKCITDKPKTGRKPPNKQKTQTNCKQFFFSFYKIFFHSETQRCIHMKFRCTHFSLYFFFLYIGKLTFAIAPI